MLPDAVIEKTSLATHCRRRVSKTGGWSNDPPADQSPVTSPPVQVRKLIALAGAKHCGDSSAIVDRTRYVIQLVLCFLAAGSYIHIQLNNGDGDRLKPVDFCYGFQTVDTRAEVNYNVPTSDVGCGFTYSSLYDFFRTSQWRHRRLGGPLYACSPSSQHRDCINANDIVSICSFLKINTILNNVKLLHIN